MPLIQHDDVIGTFNVESPSPGAFTESDLQFLEIFSRDVARALTTLELLVAQQANTALASVEAIHGEVALPVDEILNDAVNVMERYIGHEPRSRPAPAANSAKCAGYQASHPPGRPRNDAGRGRTRVC